MLLFYLTTGFFSGLNSACWGLYKDSLYEKVITFKFFRSIFIALIVGAILYFIFPSLDIEEVNLGVLFAVIVLLERFLTEIYKGFFRKELQLKYKIPSYFHWGKHIIKNKILKTFVGTLLIIFIFLIFILFNKIPPVLDSMEKHILVSIMVGLLIGILEALGGVEKDAPYEHFRPLKMFRSPLVHMIWGLIFSFFTYNYALILFASGGAGRMTIELYKTYITHKTPGKFKAGLLKYLRYFEYRKWLKERGKVVLPYIASWIFFITMLLS